MIPAPIWITKRMLKRDALLLDLRLYLVCRDQVLGQLDQLLHRCCLQGHVDHILALFLLPLLLLVLVMEGLVLALVLLMGDQGLDTALRHEIRA
jgi:hypothetical protein